MWFSLIILTLISLLSSSGFAIKYNLVTYTPSIYSYNNETIEASTIKSTENAFSITILSEIPILRKSMLQIDRKLFHFWLDYKNLSEIEPGVFDNQNINEQLRFEGNKLRIIKTGTFRNMPVQYIAITRNEIEVIEDGAFENLPNLNQLSLSRNKIVDLNPGIALNTPKLKFFDAVLNRIIKIGPNAFDYMRKNESADAVGIGLNDNQIAEVDDNAFSGLEIYRLDLSNNSLKVLSDDFIKNTDVSSLGLDNNQLESLPEALFKSPRLTQIHLKGNRLNCEFAKALKILSKEKNVQVVYDNEHCE